MIETKYFLINKDHDLVSGYDYGSEEAAREVIEKGKSPNNNIDACNIPNNKIKLLVLPMRFTNGKLTYNFSK